MRLSVMLSAAKYLPTIFGFALLALPWQTRWFGDATLAGWPWEQGRIAVYGSWIFMIAAILSVCHSCAVPAGRQEGGNLGQMDPRIRVDDGGRWPLIALITLSFVGALFDPSSLKAVFQWWIQVLLIAFFGRATLRLAVPARTIAAWCVVSLMPHLGLAAWQQFSQQVVGSKWLGMATQLPATLGVSVIENGGERILRLYGGFPHPNIFGGWLALGLVTSLWLALTETHRRRAIVWSLSAAVMAMALVLTFARGAWIAAIVGVAALLITGIKHKKKLLIFLPALIAGSLVFVSQRDLIFSRLAPTSRLETKSLNSRADSLREGFALLRRQPFFGTGSNAELAALARLRGYDSSKPSPTPLESPHNVALLALVNFGLIGSLLLGYCVIRFLSAFHLPSSLFHLPFSIFLLPLLVIALFDHYLWSYWSGQALAGVVALLIATQQKTRHQTDQAVTAEVERRLPLP